MKTTIFTAIMLFSILLFAQAIPLTNYTVTASNYSGSTTAIVSFQVTN